MWLLERRRDVLRIGRERVELWQRSPAGLALQDQRTLEPADAPAAGVLEAALHQLFTRPSAERASRRMDVVLESAWLPVMAFELGEVLWPRERIEALLRHRFGQWYGDSEVQAWHLRLDHRPGDPAGVGYGLAPAVQRAIDSAAQAAGIRLASLQPAFAWGWQQLRRRRKGGRGWWLWLEQDRSLIAWVERRRVRFLNAGGSMPGDEASTLRLLQVESLRQGVSELNVCGVVAGWPNAVVDAGLREGHGLVCAEVSGASEASSSMQAPANDRGAA